MNRFSEIGVGADNYDLCVVAGNSGSLLETPKQSEWSRHHLKGHSPYLIGTNRILRRGLDGREYAPDLVVFNDRRVLKSDHNLFNQTFAKGERRFDRGQGSISTRFGFLVVADYLFRSLSDAGNLDAESCFDDDRQDAVAISLREFPHYDRISF